MMKNVLLPAIIALLPMQAMAADKDSVYTWGAWAKGIQPAAGPVVKATPPPAEQPDVNFRPNENSAFLREATVVSRPAPPAAPNAPQMPDLEIIISTVPPGSDRFDQF